MVKKYTKIGILALFFSSILFGSSPQDYRKGYQEGTKALQEQFNKQGWRQKEVIFKNFIVALPTKSLAINDVAYICNMARHEGYSPIITKSLIIFGDYSRSADSEYNSKYINGKLKLKTYGQNAKGKKFYTYPLFKNIYDKMEEDIIEKNDVLVITKYSHKIKIVPQKCKKQRRRGRKVIYFRIKKNIAQGYTYENLKEKASTNSNFIPFRIFKDNDQLYKKGKVITTKDGAKYIKVYNKNLFFKAKLVKIMAIYI